MNGFISWMNSAGEGFVFFAIRMLIQSSVLIAVLLLLDLVLRKRVRAVVRYWIWLLVLAKLLLPPSLSAPTSLAWWLGDKLPETSVALVGTTPESENEIPSPLPAPQAPPREIAVTQPAIHSAISPAAAVPSKTNDATTPALPAPTWQALALAAWVIVAAVMLVLLAQRAAFVRGLVLQSQEAPERMLDLLERCRRQMRVRTAVRLRLTSLSASPSVCGLARPTILIPERMLARLDHGQLKSILLHELAHVRRADLWVNLAQTLLQIAYVYHPLVWLANAMIRKVREQAVDETVLAAMGDEAETYPKTLLTVSKLAFDRPALSLRLIGVVESKRSLTARIRHMVGRPFPTSARLGLASVVLVLAVGATLLPMAKARHNPEAVAESMATALPAVTTPEPGTVYPQEAVAPAGVVVDEKGSPVPGARILLYHRMSSWGLNNRIVEQTRTDAQGRFTLTEPLAYKNNNGTTYTDHFLLFATHPDHAMAWHVIVAGQEKAEYRLTMTEPVTQAFRVTDCEGQPLAGARVWICGAGLDDDANPLLRPYVGIPEDIGLLTAITDGQGRTTLGNLPGTLCSVRASMPGYSHRYVRVGVPPQAESHVEMTQAGTVTGRVLTADSKPVVGAEVWFQADWGEWYFDYATTDATGRFLNDTMVARGGSWVDDGGSGQYKVTIRHPDFTAPECVVQLEPGRTDAFDIEAVEGTLLRVHALEPETERAIAGARVAGESVSGRLDGRTDANGIFERRVLNGDASAFFYGPPEGTYVMKDLGSSVRVLAQGGIEDVTVYAPSRLHPLVGIKGRLLLPDGSAAAGLRISTLNAGRYHTLSFGGSGGAYTRTNPDGSFELKEVPRDLELFLYAETGDHKYVLAEVLDPAQASPELARPLVMKAGGTASVVLTDKSGKPRANMPLKLRPRKWENYVFRADDRPAVTDAEGRLTLDGIVPGLEYFIRDAKANLSESGWWNLYNENRVLLPLDGSAAAPDEAGATLSGIVTDPLGRPRGNVYLAPSGRNLWEGTRSDVHGRFVLKDVPPGQTVWAAWSQPMNAMGLLTIPAGPIDRPIRVTLAYSEAAIEGRVVGSDGKGLAGRKVEFVVKTADGTTWTTRGQRETDEFGNYTHGLIPCGVGVTVQVRLADAGEAERRYITKPVALSDGQIFVAMPRFVIGEGQPPETDDGKMLFRGRVVNERQEAIHGARVSLNFRVPGWMSMWVKTTQTDQDGRWQMRVPREHTNLFIRLDHPDYIGHHFDQSSERPSKEELVDGTCVQMMMSGVRISGVVKDEQGKPIEDAFITSGRLYSWSPYGEVDEDSTTARTLADGTFSIGGLPEDRLDMTVAATGYGPRIVPVEIRNNMPPVEITLSPGRTYAGQVVDANNHPVEGVGITMDEWRINGQQHHLTRIETTDAQGCFQVKDLPNEGTLECRFGKRDGGFMGFSREIPPELSQMDKIVMYKVPVFIGKVIDVETENSVTEFTLVNGIRSDSDSSPRWSDYSQEKIDTENGTFRHTWGGFAVTSPFTGDALLKIEAEGYLAEMAPPVRFGREGKPFVVRLTRAAPLKGRVLPTLKDLAVELPADAAGKMLLVCFWDMNQRPSRNTVTQLAERTKELADKGLVIVAVHSSTADRAGLNQWIDQNKIPFPVGQIQGDVNKTRSAWGARSLPWLILTDKDHIVQAEGFDLGELQSRIEAGPRR